MTDFLTKLREANKSRVVRWHPHGGLNEWSGLEWAGALCGEGGELAEVVLALAVSTSLGRVANTVKKIRREELGLRGLNHADDLILELKKEMGDVIGYLDLLAAKYDISLEEASRMVFNAKSEQYGFPERV